MANETASRFMRIGEVAEQTGVTPRTIRYYEEIGLLGPGTQQREHGKHRCYTEADAERIGEIVRLRDLLGLSLDQLSDLVEAETARNEIRREFAGTDDPDRKRELLREARGHIANQLGLVRCRIVELNTLEQELLTRQASCERRLEELGRG